MWANAIPLVTLLGVIFGAGIFVGELRAMRRDLNAHKADDDKKFEEIKKEFDASSIDQGRRIGNLEAEQRASAKAEDVRREFSGRVTTGRDE